MNVWSRRWTGGPGSGLQEVLKGLLTMRVKRLKSDGGAIRIDVFEVRWALRRQMAKTKGAKGGWAPMLFKIWLKDSAKELPAEIWKSVRILSSQWIAADGIRLEVAGDGTDVEQIIRSRHDLFNYYEKTDPGLISSPEAASKPEDDFEIEYHLTPHGWKRGSEWFFGRIQAATPAPADRVLTLRKRLYQRSGASSPEIIWTTIWQKPGLDDDVLQALRARFPLGQRA